MSYDNPRIDITDDMLSVIVKLSEGNPGAVTVLARIVKESSAIDPDDAFGSLGPMLHFDTLGIYGSKIWGLYKYVCSHNLVNMLAVLRAAQLGIVSETEVHAVIDSEAPEGWAAGLLAQVQERLPAFGK